MGTLTDFAAWLMSPTQKVRKRYTHFINASMTKRTLESGSVGTTTACFLYQGWAYRCHAHGSFFKSKVRISETHR